MVVLEMCRRLAGAALDRKGLPGQSWFAPALWWRAEGTGPPAHRSQAQSRPLWQTGQSTFRCKFAGVGARWSIRPRPTTTSLGIGGGGTLNGDMASTYDLDDPRLVSCLVFLRREPQLTEIVAAWDDLAPAIRVGILATVRAASEGGQQ